MPNIVPMLSQPTQQQPEIRLQTQQRGKILRPRLNIYGLRVAMKSAKSGGVSGRVGSSAGGFLKVWRRGVRKQTRPPAREAMRSAESD